MYKKSTPTMIQIKLILRPKRPNKRFKVILNHSKLKHIIVVAHFLLLLIQPTLSLSMSTRPSQQPKTDNQINKILCVGICSLDTLATLDEFPTPDAKIRSTSLTHAGGGNAANTAVAISRISKNIIHNISGVQVDLLSAIGDDSNGDCIISGLKEENIGTTTIERFHGNSPWSYIMVVGDTRTIIHQGSTRDLSIDYVKKKLLLPNHMLNEYGAVHFDVRHPEAASYVARECLKLGIPYSVDVERPREGLLDLLFGASIVICNSNYIDLVDKNQNSDCLRDENEDKVKRLKKVLNKKAPNAKIGIMTLGSKGSFLVVLGDDESKIHQDKNIIFDDNLKDGSPFVFEKYGAIWCGVFSNCNVVDTTGAGDVFQGGFLSAIWGYAMYKQRGGAGKRFNVPTDKVVLSHALRIASRVAAKKVEKAGARDGIPKTDTFIETEFNAMKLL